MAKGFAAIQKSVADTTEQTTTTVPFNVVEQTVKLTVEYDAEKRPFARIDRPYVRVPEVSATSDGLALITWHVVQPDPAHGGELRLDTPGITFFGESPNMVKLEVTKTSCRALWSNNRPSQSYSYRVHLVLITPGPEGPIYTPITNDPIIHNDPPTVE
jgi:DMSO/TMAO reductase YedYZ molybdopterin-dependent catalytic subunit